MLALVGREAGPAGYGGRGADAARALAGAVEGAEGRVLDGGLVVVGQGQLDEAVEVLEHLGIALDRGLPVLVDAPLQLRLGGGDLVGMRLRTVVVVCVVREPFQVLGVGGLASLCEKAEILEDVVLCMSSYP